MAYFTTRVVLHAWATAADYQTLHAAMAQAGFSHQITASDNAVYELPPAEYVMIGAYKLSDVLEAADRAAAMTGKRDSILVTEGATLTWRGLKRVQ